MADTNTADPTSRLLEEPGAALLVVDVQRDLLPGGAFGVPDGDSVIAALTPADPPYPVHVSPRLRKLANVVDAMNPP